MNIDAIEVYKCPNKKIRVGNKIGDGGYVLCDGYDYDCLLSAGIGGDISFEEEFLDRYPRVPCFAFDGTDSAGFPKTSKNITYFAKNIGSINSDKESNLIEYLNTYNNIFLKMDIEGSEFSWISAIPRNLMKKIKQIVIEFHYPLNNAECWNQLNRLNFSHSLVHLHPNPGCKYQKCNTGNQVIMIPNVFECTYIRRDFLDLSDEIIPGPLDKPNSINEFEIELLGYPYNTV